MLCSSPFQELEDPALSITLHSASTLRTAPTVASLSNLKKPRNENYPYSDLSQVDDFCTELFLDKLYLGYETHKFTKRRLWTSNSVQPEPICAGSNLNSREANNQTAFENLTSSDALSTVITFYIRNYIVDNKDVDTPVEHIFKALDHPEKLME